MFALEQSKTHMKIQTLLVLILILIAGCGGVPPPATVVAIPQTPGTPFPTLPVPTDAQAPSLQPALAITPQVSAPSAATLPPTGTAIPAATGEPASNGTARAGAPAIVKRFDLNPLPGEGRSPVALALLGSTLYVANRTSSNLAIVKAGS